MTLAIQRLAYFFVTSGYAVFAWWHVSSLLARPHYQFVLVLPLLLAALLRSRDDEKRSPGDFRWTPLIALMLVGSSMLLVLATWAWSPWVAVLSGLVTSFCVLWLRTGWGGLPRWLPTWLMCWILLPPPFGWDERLTVALRGITTRATSSVLDLFGQLHISYMNVIKVPQKSLFIADACSGVHSLFVLLAASLFWGLLYRRSAIHTLLLMTTTFGLVLLENITRLVVIVLALPWRIDLSSGPDHTVLGLILFLASAGLIVSTDQLLLFLLPQRGVQTARPETSAAHRKVSHLETTAVPPRWAQYLFLSLTPLFAICGLVQWLSMPGPLPDLTTAFKTAPELKELGKEGMPQSLLEFSQLDYARIERVIGDPFGQQSQQWVYTHGPLVAQISIDYPYDSFHDATLCYLQTGWTIERAEVLDRVSGNDAAAPTRAEPVAVVHMSRGLEGSAILMFSQLDRDGVAHARLKDRSAIPRVEDARHRFQSFFSRSKTPAVTEGRPPFIQVQLLARSNETLTDEDAERLLPFYEEFRRRARNQVIPRTVESETHPKR